MKIYHILNGDCLADKFPAEIPGEIIIWRECLIDGPVSGMNFFEIRKNYLDSAYETDADYDELVFSEWKKIVEIQDESEVYLWFEEDAFCQTNLWFLLAELKKISPGIFRVLPDFDASIFDGFRNAESPDLGQLFHHSVAADPKVLEIATDLWSAFSQRNLEELNRLSDYHSDFFPNLKASVKAVTDIKSGQINIILDLLRSEFGSDWKSAFACFSKQNPQFGLGDLQFKKLYI